MEPSAASLNTNDVFVLGSAEGRFMWQGLGSTEEEVAAAKHVADYLGGSLSEVKEGGEPGKPTRVATRLLLEFKYLILCPLAVA